MLTKFIEVAAARSATTWMKIKAGVLDGKRLDAKAGVPALSALPDCRSSAASSSASSRHPAAQLGSHSSPPPRSSSRA